MRVLVLGNDGRAHAVTWKLLNSSSVSEVVCAPGNGGTAPLASMVELPEPVAAGAAHWCFDEAFDLIVPTESKVLSAGLADEALPLRVAVCGPPGRTAKLATSRCRTKEFLLRNGLPTAPGRPFSDLATAEKYLATQPLPVLIKADHPSGGEQIYHDRYAALTGLRTMFASRPLEAEQGGVVIEAFLPGPRVVLSAFTDGETTVPLLVTRLYDRVDAQESSPIAVGIGAHTSNSKFSQQLTEYMHRRLLIPVVASLEKEGLPCWGTIGVDCIVTADGPRVTAVRFALREGEAQVVLPRLEDDFAVWAQAMLAKRVRDMPPLRWKPTPSVGLGMFARGYPISYPYGGFIHGLEDLDEGVLAFHSSTANPAVAMSYTPKRGPGLDQMLGQLFRVGGTMQSTGLHSTGGLVLTIVAQGVTLTSARARVLVNAERVQFDARTYRDDIGAKEFA
jgi:phosphoribosylamine---glycine ligase